MNTHRLFTPMQIVFVFEFKFSRLASLPHYITQLKI
jgi:hypothetical protein